MKKRTISNQMRNVAKISSGTVMGQIISVISLPIITRLYGAEIIGAWTTINSISTILIYFCDLGMSQAIMVEDDKKTVDLYCVITTISVFICLISVAAIFPYYRIILRESVHAALVSTFFVVAYTFAFRQVQTCYVWLNREKQYDILMKNPAINYSAIAIFSIALGLLGCKTYGYYIGTTLGQVLTLLHMKRSLPKRMFCFDWSKIRRSVAENNEFVKFQMPAQIAAQTRQQIPNLLIGSLFGNTVLGYFSVSQKLISIPINFIGQALGKVFYQTLAERSRRDEAIAEFIDRNMKRAIKVAFIPMVLFTAYGDAAIVMFFGSEYAIGGVISRIMVFRACFTFISTALTGIDIVLRKQKYSMLTCVAQTVFASLAVVCSYYLTKSILICTFAIVIVFIIIQMMYFGKMYSILGLQSGSYYRNILLLLFLVVICSYMMRYLFLLITNVTGCGFLEWLKGFLVLRGDVL